MKPLFVSVIALTLLSGCFDGSGSGDDDRSAGKITAHGIAGLSYQTASQSGVTDTTGQFRYYPGETLQLKVGELLIAENVPTQDYVTPLEFLPEIRARLNNAEADDEGLSSHRLIEQQLTKEVAVLNRTRLLLSLNWNRSVKNQEPLTIQPRVIEQLNATLPYIDPAIDFNVPAAQFAETGETLSPANQLLASICFFPEGDSRCDPPPTQAEIDAAPPRPSSEETRDPSTLYKEDLINKQKQIAGSIRKIDLISEEDATNYLTRGLDEITRVYENRYYLAPVTSNIKVNDTAIKRVTVKKIGGSVSLAALEAVSTRPLDVHIHAYNAQTNVVEYFADTEAGGESDVLINFKPNDGYRWLKKAIRVVVK